MAKVNIYSCPTLEPWDFSNPWTKGIGGSETAHIELAERLGQKGHEVISYVPQPAYAYMPEKRGGVSWRYSGDANPSIGGNWIVFRDSAFFDRKLGPGQYIFVAQDVDYEWSPSRLNKVDKYIVLCQTHAEYTLKKYPEVREKVFLSSNGIRTEIIEQVEKEGIVRNPNKLIYASSPDRGLLTILENWFRIRERCRDAELHGFYGFENMDAILAASGGNAWFKPMKNEIHKLLNQPGVKFRGRIGQMDLYREWFSSNVWWYPTDWPETSCITCMDAQATGALPVCTNYWALKSNVFHGMMTNEIPQQNKISLCRQIDQVIDWIRNPDVEWRGEMMKKAREEFDWNRIVDQFVKWL